MCRSIVTLAGALLVVGSVLILAVAENPKPAESPQGKPGTKWAPAVPPKPLSQQVERGLAWLAEHQLPTGAWGQGEESTRMGGGAALKDTPSVADTAIAALALVRAGSTPAKGSHARPLRQAVEFLCQEIARADQDSLYITSVRGTRVQAKLGPFIDTFLANIVLAEVSGQMPDAASEQRVAAALNKVLAKIQKNQRPDGTWGGEGWATTLQQGLAVKSLNRAAQSGAAIDETVRARAEQQARQNFDKASGKFKAEGSAGVQLYSAGSNLGSVAESVKTNRQQQGQVERKLASPTATPGEKAEARATLERFQAAEEDLRDAQMAVVARLDDKQFMAGFGSNGGEEFLSYMNIGESLVVKGGDTWKSWDKSITENLNRIQNSDGSWSGHHCITGRTFCTSAALLVLLVDRSPQPIAEKVKRR